MAKTFVDEETFLNAYNHLEEAADALKDLYVSLDDAEVIGDEDEDRLQRALGIVETALQLVAATLFVIDSLDEED